MQQAAAHSRVPIRDLPFNFCALEHRARQEANSYVSAVQPEPRCSMPLPASCIRPGTLAAESQQVAGPSSGSAAWC